MEERSVAILTILIIFMFFMLFYKKSTYVNQNISNISCVNTEEIKSEESNIITIDQYPDSVIWKIGETLKIGDFKQSPNGIYKLIVENTNIKGNIYTALNSYNPKFEKLTNIVKNPMKPSLGGPGSIFTLTNNGIVFKDSIGAKGLRGFPSNSFNKHVISNLPNPDGKTYNLYNNDGTFNQLLTAPQSIIKNDNYIINFNVINTVDHIIFMDDGVKAFDKDNKLLFVDLF
jgi:hypothetical protein